MDGENVGAQAGEELQDEQAGQAAEGAQGQDDQAQSAQQVAAAQPRKLPDYESRLAVLASG